MFVGIPPPALGPVGLQRYCLYFPPYTCSSSPPHASWADLLTDLGHVKAGCCPVGDDHANDGHFSSAGFFPTILIYKYMQGKCDLLRIGNKYIVQLTLLAGCLGDFVAMCISMLPCTVFNIGTHAFPNGLHWLFEMF